MVLPLECVCMGVDKAHENEMRCNGMELIKLTKDKMYYHLVEKNEMICREYQAHVDNNLIEHSRKRWKHWAHLLRLNIKYRVLRKQQTNQIAPMKKLVKKEGLYFGCESTLSNQKKPYHFARQLLDYKMISFDIFDTLILRPFKSPVDLFSIVVARLNYEGFNESFSVLRVKAESEARNLNEKKFGYREVSIYDIYNILSTMININIDEAIAVEFQVELEYCSANPYMFQVYQIMKSQNKEIIIVSDMYWPSCYMIKLLEHNGYTSYTKLYVSSDYHATKATGSLYEFVLSDNRQVEIDEICHIGDNYNSDIVQAEKKGITTFRYFNVHECGNPYRSPQMTKLVGSIYSGIVNSYLHSGANQCSFFFEYGFIYMGLPLYGMSQWLDKKVKQIKADKIFFLARDGYYLQKVFNLCTKDVESEYVLWSRNASIRYVVAERNFEEYLARFLTYRVNDSQSQIIAEDLIYSLGVNCLDENLKNYGLTLSSELNKATLSCFRCLLIDNKLSILKEYEEQREVFCEYLREKIGNAKKLILTDVGWTGHNLMHLKYLIQRYVNPDCEIFCYMMFEKGGVNTVNLLSETLDSYIFSTFHNRNLIWQYHNKNNSAINTPFFEIGLQPNQPSFSGVNVNGEFIFDVPLIEDYAHSEEIEQGIMEFSKIYQNTTQYDTYLRNVSGVDAYAPFSLTVQNISFIKKYFSDFKIELNVGGVKSKQSSTGFLQQVKK